jgi:hypothetical protein
MNSNRVSTELLGKDNISGTYVIVGKGGSGKSTFIRWFIQDRVENAGWKFGLVFTATKFNKGYDWMPKDKVIEGYSEQTLMKYVNNLKKVAEEAGNDSLPESWLIFDDLVGVLENGSDWWTNFVTISRHLHINLVLSVQYLTGKKAITPIMREQTTHAIMFKSKTNNTIENLYKNYGQLFDSYKEWKEYFWKHTEEKHSALLFIQSGDDIEDSYYSIKSPDPDTLPPFKMKF